MVGGQFPRPNPNFIVGGTAIEIFTGENEGEDIGGVALKGGNTLMVY